MRTTAEDVWLWTVIALWVGLVALTWYSYYNVLATLFVAIVGFIVAYFSGVLFAGLLLLFRRRRRD